MNSLSLGDRRVYYYYQIEYSTRVFTEKNPRQSSYVKSSGAIFSSCMNFHRTPIELQAASFPCVLILSLLPSPSLCLSPSLSSLSFNKVKTFHSIQVTLYDPDFRFFHHHSLSTLLYKWTKLFTQVNKRNKRTGTPFTSSSFIL